MLGLGLKSDVFNGFRVPDESEDFGTVLAILQSVQEIDRGGFWKHSRCSRIEIRIFAKNQVPLLQRQKTTNPYDKKHDVSAL